MCHFVAILILISIQNFYSVVFFCVWLAVDVVSGRTLRSSLKPLTLRKPRSDPGRQDVYTQPSQTKQL